MFIHIIYELCFLGYAYFGCKKFDRSFDNVIKSVDVVKDVKMYRKCRCVAGFSSLSLLKIRSSCI